MTVLAVIDSQFPASGEVARFSRGPLAARKSCRRIAFQDRFRRLLSFDRSVMLTARNVVSRSLAIQQLEGRPFRGHTTAAPLKPIRKVRYLQTGATFPRSYDRGPIEAVCSGWQRWLDLIDGIVGCFLNPCLVSCNM